ncbi:clavesin-2-like [Anopheles cruzii]|uniref:clavesin-2-like n=1 Tax=Anopheles cruzii TaxID=68878 RepID=UPI0022EC8B25|nr:clavesin-2-like [Anopheles cruzii]
MAFSVVKCPPAYDEYRFTLPEQYRQIAKEELREDDATREQALTEMRQWIVDNPHIQSCRTDAKFLLRFLRFRQFSVPMACEALERYLSFRRLYPSWFKNLDCNEVLMSEIIKNGPFLYLGQDTAGRAVMLIRFGRFDGQKHLAMPDGRYAALIMETMLESEEMQIGGVQVLIDFTETTVDNYDKWGTSELKIIMEAFSRSYPLRYGEIHAAGLPKFGIPVVDTFLSFANPKMREKIRCYSTITELKQLIEPHLKPTEYGGQVNMGELSRSFWKRIEEQRQVVLGLDRMQVDVDHYAAVWDEEDPSPAEAAAGAVLKHIDFH